MIIPTYSRYRIILYWLIALFVFSSCDPMYVTQKCPSYVVCYNDIRSIELSPLTTNTKGLVINCGNDRPVMLYSLNSTDKEKDMYDWLCNKHHDLNYNQYRSFPKGLPSESVTYNDQDYLSIELTSDTDFDESHPTGSNLADIIRFISWSPYKYICSGYTEYYHYDSSNLSKAFNTIMPIYFGAEWFQSTTNATCYPIDKIVSELIPEDLILLGHDAPGLLGIIVFEVPPTNKGAQNITVKMKTDTGMIFEDVIRLTF